MGVLTLKPKIPIDPVAVFMTILLLSSIILYLYITRVGGTSRTYILPQLIRSEQVPSLDGNEVPFYKSIYTSLAVACSALLKLLAIDYEWLGIITPSDLCLGVQPLLPIDEYRPATVA